ncbi:MAG: shikimate dehydrogenase [Oscillospiraceae bacterium]|nr:shikimate dehydrogenase [Oscillospiraceae bacterium]
MAFVDARIDARTRRFALLGERLPYTWSPQIHNSLFAAGGHNAVYLPLPVPGACLASALDTLRAGFEGFNVTIPYKEAVIPFLDELSPAASACGAVNTVFIGRDGGMTGHITDGVGILRALQEAWVDQGGADVLIVGGGGTARVAAYEMLARSNRVTLAVRAPERAQKLLADLAALQKDGAERLRLISLEELEQKRPAFDLLMHCTPVGTAPDTDACLLSRAVVACCGAVMDVVYNPPQSRLLQMAEAEGCKCINGFGMLFYQAAEAQKIWLGHLPPAKALRELRRDLERYFQLNA